MTMKTRDDRVDLIHVPSQLRVRIDVGHSHARGTGGGVLARAAAEDERVQQRVGAEAVAAVHRHAGHLAGRIEAID
jgi:hypothetical protein